MEAKACVIHFRCASVSAFLPVRSFPSLFTVLAIFSAASFLGAAEPFLKPHDVVAFVGGEDMVAMSEYGYLELLLTRALPDHQLRFRSLAWEGDTVFEQPRDLNFPTLEQQLDKIGATVVIAQFGQMESLAGTEKLPEFIAAYGKLIERLKGDRKRKLILISPCEFARADQAVPRYFERLVGLNESSLQAYLQSIRQIASDHGANLADLFPLIVTDTILQRDGVHLTALAHSAAARHVFDQFGVPGTERLTAFIIMPPEEQLRQLIVAKNRLWSNYWRPQNWAFLNGDRTSQPSSRDYLDPSKRWFPAEIEEFVPLIEAKEREIALAAKLAKP